MAGVVQPFGLNYGYNDPTKPPPQTEGGNWAWDVAKGLWSFVKDNAGSLIGAAGNAVGAYESEKQTAAKLAEQKAEFEANLKQRQAEEARAASQFGRTTGNEEAQAAVRAQTQLNKAPIADKAQALILARMGVSPGQFKPRDYTQGQASLTTPNAAPGANVASTMQHAASAYTPGSGGVNTDYLKALIAKMSGSSGLPTKPTTPTEPPYKPQFPINNGPPPVKPTIRPPVTPIQPPVDQPPDQPAPTDNSDENPKDPSTFLLRKMRPLY